MLYSVWPKWLGKGRSFFFFYWETTKWHQVGWMFAIVYRLVCVVVTKLNKYSDHRGFRTHTYDVRVQRSWNIYILLSDLFPNHEAFACKSLALLTLPEGKWYIDLYKLFTTTAKPFLWKLGCRSKDCFDLYLAYLFNLASDSEKSMSFPVICRAPFIRLFLLLAADLSTFCIWETTGFASCWNLVAHCWQSWHSVIDN